MTPPITMSAPDIRDPELAAVADVLRSGRLALGRWAEAFERAVAEFVGVRHAVAVQSGTAALHLAVRGLGIGPGDEVLVPSFTFVASVNPLLYEGAHPVFVDVEPDTLNLDPADLERKITPRTKAILPVDVFGHPVEWDAVERLAKAHGLRVIDDACEALGAEYRGRRLGSLGDAATFGFYPNKQLTTGEGGMLVTEHDELAALARSMRNQGRDEMGAWLVHPRLGFNYRLNEMSAALGAVQMERIDGMLDARTRVAMAYDERLRAIEGLEPPHVRAHVRPSWFVYVVKLPHGRDRDAVMARMEARGIPVRGYFPPVHLQEYVRRDARCRIGELPVTEAMARRTMALPFHGKLTEAQIDRVVEVLDEVLDEVPR